MVALHTSLIFAFPDKNMFIWMYIFSYYILYVNNNNAYIYLKIVHSQIGSGGGRGVIYFRLLFRPSFLINKDFLYFFLPDISRTYFLPTEGIFYLTRLGFFFLLVMDFLFFISRM